MKRTKIAPVLQDLADGDWSFEIPFDVDNVEWERRWSVMHRSASDQLRALLSVAIAAEKASRRYRKMWARYQNKVDDGLVRALARLAKVSQP